MDKTLTERLVFYRYKHKLSKIDMVKRLGGVSYEAYLKWESGLTTPKAENLERVEKLLKD